MRAGGAWARAPQGACVTTRKVNVELGGAGVRPYAYPTACVRQRTLAKRCGISSFTGHALRGATV